MLEVLDVTYNNLSELPNNFHYLNTLRYGIIVFNLQKPCIYCWTAEQGLDTNTQILRALYLGDNDFKNVPNEVIDLKNLQILSLRDNEITELPAAIGQMTKLTELLIQNNFLVILPVDLTLTDLANPKNVFRADNNPFDEELLRHVEVCFRSFSKPEYLDFSRSS